MEIEKNRYEKARMDKKYKIENFSFSIEIQLLKYINRSIIKTISIFL